VKLTDRSAAVLVLPAGKTDHVFWDDVPGFGVRLRGDRQRCSKSWLAQYRVGVRQHRESLGDIRKVKIEDARKAARKLFAQVELGIDPAAEKAKARAAAAATLTMGSVADRYLAAKRPDLRPNSYAQAASYLADHWRPLRNRPLDGVARADIAARVQDLANTRGRIAAARARGQLSALFVWAMREGLAERNPVASTNSPDKGVKPRERVLSDNEIRAIWRCCLDDDFSRIVKLLLLTGCRRDEIGDLGFSEIDFDTGTLVIPGKRTKNGRALQLKLPAVALDILRAVPRRDGCDHVFGKPGKGFTSWSHGMRLFQARMVAADSALPHFTLHDLRRSSATHMAEIGIAPHIIEAILNHVSGHKRGVAGIYNRAQYTAEKTIALAQWADHVMAIVEGRKRKIVPLKRA
jgi:integrase